MSDKAQFLFLDRDGVLNVRPVGRYVSRTEEFIFEKGVLEALRILRPLFRRIVVVTNQAGIGKGLMTAADLALIHHHLQAEATAHGCPIDGFFYCPDPSGTDSPCRKPHTGMGWAAKAQFPEIDFQQSWMVGDSASDIEFGERLDMKTALVTGKIGEENDHLRPTLRVSSLLEFAHLLL
jgi:D-glycero-D-manno-heptose 1,7-bisphosphate phosphatase